jgi:hypothetical protein
MRDSDSVLKYTECPSFLINHFYSRAESSAFGNSDNKFDASKPCPINFQCMTDKQVWLSLINSVFLFF